MKFKVTKKITGPKSFKREVQRRMRAAARVCGRAVAAGLQEEVVKRIPRGQRWLDIYREAIQFLETPDGSSWAVAGLSPIELTTVPAETTQVKVKSGKTASVVANILAGHNPWTIDQLPGMSGGIPAEAEVRPATADEVQAHRRRLVSARDGILDRLNAAGAQITDDFPRFGGLVLVDLPFLQLAIEHGLRGFPRAPHWLPAVRQAANKAEGWVAREQDQIKAALEGAPVPRAEQEMTRALRKRLEKRRNESWE